MALVMFVLQAISIPFIKERMPPSKGGIRVFDLRALREWRFGLHCAGAFFSAFGEYYALSSGFFSSIRFRERAVKIGFLVLGDFISV